MLFTLVSSIALSDIHYFAVPEVALRITYIQAYIGTYVHPSA